MGKIELDHTGSGGGVTLSSDGTDLLLDGTAIGGDPDLYADNTSGGYTTGATASGNGSIAIGSTATSTAEIAAAFGYGTDATGQGSSALGYLAQAAGSRAIALGNSRAGGTDSFAAQIGTNSSSYGAIGNNGTAIGMLTKANGLDFVFGRSSIASGGSGSLSLGMDNTSSGGGAVTIGKNNTASHIDAVVIGQGASSSAADEITLGHTDQTVRISSSYTLPTSDGTNGQVLTTDGSGAVTFADAGGGASEYTIDDKTAAYTVVSGDLGKIINCTSGTFTITLTAAATLGSGFHVTIWNLSTTSSDAITIDPNASETIDGKSTFILRRGEGVEVVCDGTNFQTGKKKAMRGHADNIPASYIPVASGNISLAMGGRATASGSLRSIAIGDNATASNTESLAMQNTATASGSASIAIGKSTTASASNGLAVGYNAQAVSGSDATALTNSRASGASSFAAAIANNTSSYGATGANSIAMGELAKATATDSVAIGSGASATQSQNFAVGHGASATGTNANAFGRLSVASGSASHAFGLQANASGSYATAIGRGSGVVAQASGSGSTSIGGSYSSGTDSLAAAITNSTSSYGATGANSVALGQLAKATGANGLALGRETEATATQAVAVGRNVVASGSYSAAFGTDSTASANYSTVIGHQGVSDIIGKIAFAGGYDFSANGDVQQGLFILRSDTTDATAEALTTNNSTASTDNQVILPNNSAYSFSGTIIARESATDGTDCAAWKVEGLIRREANAGTTVLVNSATTVLDNTPSWGLALSADTTNGGLKVEATGAASTNIRWVATIHTSEVIYA